MIATRTVTGILLLGWVLALSLGCKEDTNTKTQPDEMTLSVAGEKARTVEEEKDNNFYGYDPLVSAATFDISSITSLKGISGARQLSAATADTSIIVEMERGFAVDSRGVPIYDDEFLGIVAPAKAGTYDVNAQEALVFYGSSDYSSIFSSFVKASGTVDITEIGDAGGRINGEFSVTLTDSSTPQQSLDIEGSFKAIREPDGFAAACQNPPASGTTHYIQTLADASGFTTDTMILVYDENQDLICLNDNADGLFSQLALKLDSGKTYYVEVVGFQEEDAGAYSILAGTSGFQSGNITGTASAGSEPDNDDSSGAEKLTVDGGSLDRELDAAGGDIDWYKFTAK